MRFGESKYPGIASACLAFLLLACTTASEAGHPLKEPVVVLYVLDPSSDRDFGTPEEPLPLALPDDEPLRLCNVRVSPHMLQGIWQVRFNLPQGESRRVRGVVMLWDSVFFVFEDEVMGKLRSGDFDEDGQVKPSSMHFCKSMNFDDREEADRLADRIREAHCPGARVGGAGR